MGRYEESADACLPRRRPRATAPRRDRGDGREIAARKASALLLPVRRLLLLLRVEDGFELVDALRQARPLAGELVLCAMSGPQPGGLLDRARHGDRHSLGLGRLNRLVGTERDL